MLHLSPRLFNLLALLWIICGDHVCEANDPVHGNSSGGEYNCKGIEFVSTIRTSEYFNDYRSMRNGIISFRVFRDNIQVQGDLVLAVVIDSPVDSKQKAFLLSDLRTYDIRFVLFTGVVSNPSTGQVDLAPNYLYALKAYKSAAHKTACNVLYVSSNSLFLKDPTDAILSHADSNPAKSGIYCLRSVDQVETGVFQSFISQSAPSLEVMSAAKAYSEQGHVIFYCNPNLIFLSGKALVDRVVDVTDSLTSTYYFYHQYLPGVLDATDDPMFRFNSFDRSQHENLLLQTTLLGITMAMGRLEDSVGELPTASGSDLSLVTTGSEMSSSIDDPTPSIDLYILLSPRMPDSTEKVMFQCSVDASGTCSLDTSQWLRLAALTPAPRLITVADAAVKILQNTAYSCQLLANSVSAVAFTDYLELGSEILSTVSRPWHRGSSVSLADAAVDGSGELVTYQSAVNAAAQIRGYLSASLVHFSALYDNYAVSGIPIPIRQWMDGFISFYESIPNEMRYQMDSKEPCVLWVDITQANNITAQDGIYTNTRRTSLCESLLSLYGTKLYKLGLLPIVELCNSQPNEFLVVGPHCTGRELSRLEPLLPNHAASVLARLRSRGDVRVDEADMSEEHTRTGSEIEAEADAVPIGVAVALERGQEFKVFEDPIPPELVDFLIGRLMHKTITQKSTGANSFFIKFDGSKPRSVVEAYILDHLAPLVVGSQEEARRNGFVGAEWWIQQRAEDDPKEYHMDTAITWCRDNGWPTELLKSCFFYPAVGSVMYLTDEGGPTAVFNQTPGEFGLDPLFPSEVALMFAKRNRLLLFNGAKFHGVMRKKPCIPVEQRIDGSTNACLPRVTLLVNYWRDKTAGESFTPTVPQEAAYMDHYEALKKKVLVNKTASSAKEIRSRWDSMENLSMSREFSEDYNLWRKQQVPPVFMENIASRFEGFRFHDGEFLYAHSFNDVRKIPPPGILLKLNPSDVVQNFAIQTGYHYHNWPYWEIKDGQLEMKSIQATSEELNAWRDEMPGGNPYRKEKKNY